MKNTPCFLWLLLVLFCQSCYFDNKEDLYQHVGQQVDCNLLGATFATDIVPIMTEHCNRCHRNDRQDGNVNLEGYNNIKPYADDGSLYGTTNHEPGFSVMPTNGIKIPFCEIEKLRLWIESGAQNN